MLDINICNHPAILYDLDLEFKFDWMLETICRVGGAVNSLVSLLPSSYMETCKMAVLYLTILIRFFVSHLNFLLCNIKSRRMES